jgi:hypothetical protein
MRKGTMIGEWFDERQREDPLKDTASHMPPGSHQSRLGKLIEFNHDIDLRQTEGLQPEGSNQ